MYALSGGVWSQTAYVKASNTAPDASFGGSVSVSGSVLAVGAQYEARRVVGERNRQTQTGIRMQCNECSVGTEPQHGEGRERERG